MTLQKTLITKEELANLPLRSYDGPLFLVSTPRDLERAREDFRNETTIGLDTETPPTFRVGDKNLPSLVQVATPRAVHLFQLNQSHSPQCFKVLAELFENTEIIKAGIGLAHDFKTLQERFTFQQQNTLDLTTIAKQQGLEQSGVRNLAGLFLGFRISKGQKTTNWGRDELTRQQILYAATDAWVCLELYRCFQKKGFIQ